MRGKVTPHRDCGVAHQLAAARTSPRVRGEQEQERADHTSGPLLFTLAFGLPELEARAMSAAERANARLASLSRLGSIGRGASDTSLPSRSARMPNTAMRP